MSTQYLRYMEILADNMNVHVVIFFIVQEVQSSSMLHRQTTALVQEA